MSTIILDEWRSAIFTASDKIGDETETGTAIVKIGWTIADETYSWQGLVVGLPLASSALTSPHPHARWCRSGGMTRGGRCS